MYFGAAALAAPPDEVVSAEVAALIELEGRARVIVRLKMPRPLSRESDLSDAAAARQRADIARVQKDAANRVAGTGSSVSREFKSLPYIAMVVDEAGLARLISRGSPVESVYPDRVFKPLLIESTYQIEADIAHEAGITGAGATVVVIDTGAEKSHPFLSGKVVHEACFATKDDGRKGACPNRKTTQIGNGAGEPCTFDSLSCYHGTHVSGIAVGSSSAMTGVAPGATLIPIQVFHPSGFCSRFSPCADASVSDVVAALEHVYDIRNDYPVVAVNMSLGGGLYGDTCDAEYPLMTAAIANLKAVGIATVAAAGNDGDPGGITAPGCISAAVSVGAVDELDNVAYFSNGSTQVDLLAPGTGIDSSVPGGGYAAADGTSMATPHVAGAWAILRQAYGPQDVDAELDFLKSTGQTVTDDRGAGMVALPRLRVGPAAGIVNPAPVLSSVSPNPIRAGRDNTITVTGSGFVRSSVVVADGVAITTTFLSDTELQAVVPRSMLDPTVESITLVVESPPLGGGASAPLTINVLQPEISVASTAAAPGEVVTVTLGNGPGNQYDWLVLVPVAAPSNAWLKMTFVPAFQTGMTWNVAMPATPGNYEIRLLESGSYNVLATSATITVGDVIVEPPPDGEGPSVDLSATTAGTGETLTVTLSGGPGNQYDWMVLVPVGAPSSAWLKMTFVPAYQTGMTWNVAMPASPGNYEIRLLENGSYNVLATSATITVGQ
jgi:subtilisin family serine protease